LPKHWRLRTFSCSAVIRAAKNARPGGNYPPGDRSRRQSTVHLAQFRSFGPRSDHPSYWRAFAIRCLHPMKSDGQLRPAIRATLLNNRVAIWQSELATPSRDLADSQRECQEFERAEASLSPCRPPHSIGHTEGELDGLHSTRRLTAQSFSELIASGDSAVQSHELSPAWSNWTKDAAPKKSRGRRSGFGPDAFCGRIQNETNPATSRECDPQSALHAK